jgi:hypothetical protein
LASICKQAVDSHASLAFCLAQHNGIGQFGAENKTRPPPIEFRLVLPPLEAKIAASLEELSSLLSRLKQMDLPVDSHICEVRDSADQWLTNIHAEAYTAFEEQQSHMRQLASESSAFSPMLCPIGSLGKRLAAVISSPPGSRASPQSVCTEPTEGPSPWLASPSRVSTSPTEGALSINASPPSSFSASADSPFDRRECRFPAGTPPKIKHSAWSSESEDESPKDGDVPFGSVFKFFTPQVPGASSDGDAKNETRMPIKASATPFASVRNSTDDGNKGCGLFSLGGEEHLPYVFSLSGMSIKSDDKSDEEECM